MKLLPRLYEPARAFFIDDYDIGKVDISSYKKTSWYCPTRLTFV